MTNDEPTLDVTLRIPDSHEDLVAAFLQNAELDAERFDGAGIDGGGDWVTVLVGLGSASLTALVATLRAHWARAQAVKIEVDGMKVEGASPDDIHTILNKLLRERRRTEARASADDDKT